MHIRAGLKFITDNQLKDGGYCAYRLSDLAIEESYSTTFIPALIALALRDVPGSEPIKDKTAAFLLAQRSKQWTWNYWEKGSAAAKRWPYPDDLDATFVALAALWHYDHSLLTPHVLADITHILVAAEQAVGGPYRTWLVNDAADEVWKDVDVAVNSNVAYFLALQGVELPHLTGLFDRSIRRKDLSSPYYPSLFPTIYFMARAYKGKHAIKLQEMIIKNQLLGTWETPHRTAMAVTSLLELGYTPGYLERAVEYIKTTQRSDGSWDAGLVCRDVARRPCEGEYFIGSEALTTALCLEALHSYDRVIKKEKPAHTFTQTNHYHEVIAGIEQVINSLGDSDLKETTLAIFQKIIGSDTDGQITMLAWITAEASGQPVDEKVAHSFAAASIWGWMAYTIYDDFLDGEGNERLLPAAIFAKRQLIKTLDQVLPDNTAFKNEVNTILDHLDGANAWEVATCRGTVKENIFAMKTLPDYGNNRRLAERSFGHAIAGLGVLYAQGHAADSVRLGALRDFFLHYLIARQLTDDAHDWEEDLLRGHVNAVAVMLLRAWEEKTNRSVADGIDLKHDIKQLRLLMWEEVIDSACTQIGEHLDQARAAITRPEAEFDGRLLLGLLEPLQGAADKALQTRDQAKEFAQAL